MVEYSIWALAYFVGSIPCGVLVARTQNINVKEHGSGNIGATNVTRILGKKAGILTLAGDCLKGYLPVALANQILGNQIDLAVTGFVAFSGHIFPIFLNFKGGKGVATGLGVFLSLMPQATLCAVGIFSLTLIATGYVSASSIMASIALPLAGLWLRFPQPFIILAVVVAFIVVQKHHTNIRRLLNGTETKFPQK